MDLVKDVPVTIWGRTELVEVEVWRRPGTHSRPTYVVRYEGQRFGPLAQKKFDIVLGLGLYAALFSKYRFGQPRIDELQPQTNPFLEQL